MTPSRRMEGVRAYDKAADAFGVVARKPAPAPRFETRFETRAAPAETAVPEATIQDMVRAIPGWAVVVGGGVVAAAMGVLLGGALHI